MTVGNVEVRVGGRIWFDGQGWEVCEFADGVVRLTDGGRVRAVSVAALLSSLHDLPRAEGDSQSTDEPTDMWTIPAIMLAALSTRQLGVLEAKLAVLRRVLEPDPDDERSLGQRYEDLAAELRVSRRTLERQVSRLSELGPTGLVDGRLLQDVRRAVDPRWDSACLQVLAAFGKASNPTKQSVIRRANEAFRAAAPNGLCWQAPRCPPQPQRSSDDENVEQARNDWRTRSSGLFGLCRSPGSRRRNRDRNEDVWRLHPILLRPVQDQG